MNKTHTILLPARRNTPIRADEGTAPLDHDNGWNNCLEAVRELNGLSAAGEGHQPAASAEQSQAIFALEFIASFAGTRTIKSIKQIREYAKHNADSCTVPVAQDLAALPDGWHIVPDVPTQEMIDAGHDAYERALLGNKRDINAAFQRRWKAMLDAAAVAWSAEPVDSLGTPSAPVEPKIEPLAADTTPSKEAIDRAVAFAMGVKISASYGWPEYMLDLWKIMAASQIAAPKQEPVAYRVLRKSFGGEWKTAGHEWCDGRPSNDLMADIAKCPDSWRIEYAYGAPIAAPVAQHPDDVAVDRFAARMKAKLAKKRGDGRGGWHTASAEHLSALLREHVAKGDPIDVGNLAMMLQQNGQRIV